MQDGSPQIINYKAVTIPDMTDMTAIKEFEKQWTSTNLYILVKEYNVSGKLTERENYYKINPKGSDWKKVCKGLTEVYEITNNLSYEWLYDRLHSKFTVV